VTIWLWCYLLSPLAYRKEGSPYYGPVLKKSVPFRSQACHGATTSYPVTHWIEFFFGTCIMECPNGKKTEVTGQFSTISIFLHDAQNGFHYSHRFSWEKNTLNWYITCHGYINIHHSNFIGSKKIGKNDLFSKKLNFQKVSKVFNLLWYKVLSTQTSHS